VPHGFTLHQAIVALALLILILSGLILWAVRRNPVEDSDDQLANAETPSPTHIGSTPKALRAQHEAKLDNA
jgi:uncharacterized iron-regulated membrane protein